MTSLFLIFSYNRHVSFEGIKFEKKGHKNGTFHSFFLLTDMEKNEWKCNLSFFPFHFRQRWGRFEHLWEQRGRDIPDLCDHHEIFFNSAATKWTAYPGRYLNPGNSWTHRQHRHNFRHVNGWGKEMKLIALLRSGLEKTTTKPVWKVSSFLFSLYLDESSFLAKEITLYPWKVSKSQPKLFTFPPNFHFGFMKNLSFLDEIRTPIELNLPVLCPLVFMVRGRTRLRGIKKLSGILQSP